MKHTLTLFTALLLAPLAALHAANAPAATRPNVLLIAVDDLNPMLGCYGQGLVKSPHLDRLASAGTLFRRAYCQTALCMPSRSSLLSGYRPETLQNKARPLTGNAPPGTVTLPQLFRQNGYTTVSVGKVYHYNHDDPDGWVRRHTDTFASEGAWCDGYCSGYQLPANQATVENYLRGKRFKDGSPPPPSRKSRTPRTKRRRTGSSLNEPSRSCGNSSEPARPSSWRPASTGPTCR